MPKIDQKQVRYLADLAMLDFDEQELQEITMELENIVRYVEKINELDLDEVPETAHVLDLTNVFRDDRVEAWLTQEEALANAPAKKNGYFSVPKVIG